MGAITTTKQNNAEKYDMEDITEQTGERTVTTMKACNYRSKKILVVEMKDQETMGIELILLVRK